MAAKRDGCGNYAEFNTFASPDSKVVVANNSVINIQGKNGQPKEESFGEEESNQATELPSFVCEMKTGYVYVIHNYTFPKRDEPHRLGSEKDLESLKKLFKGKFEFKMKVENNLTASEMMEKASDISEKDFSEMDCLFFVILSHGKLEGVLGVDDEVASLTAITNMFTARECPSLAGKPKVFIIQACRGSKDDFGAVTRDADSGQSRRAAMQTIPIESEFLVCYGSPIGYSSYRDEEEGSWYIRELVRIFEKYDSDHLMDLMLRVNFAVSSKSCAQGYKQIPSEECRLTRKYYFSKHAF